MLEHNEAAQALEELLAEGPIAIETEPYGNFEAVGTLPCELPRADSQISAQPGDIMLYQGDSIVFFYGTNTWAYTRLGYVKTEENLSLKPLLGAEKKSLILSLVSQ